jgi:putative ABC transport system ATP-binding protein
MSSLIELKEVKKYYYMGETIVKALDGINLQINKGDFVAIMGPSGSGKSTAMNLVGSLDVPTHGEIYLDKQSIAHLGESELAQLRGKKIGFIFQSFNLIPNLTVKENVALPMLFQHYTEEERNKKAIDLLKKVGLEHRTNYYPNKLSGGEQQRVAIARALINDPEVILADEPTGNLDTKRGEMIMEFLDDLHKKGKTIVIITHDRELGEKHAQKIFWIKDGKIEKVTKKSLEKWKKIDG